MRGCTGGVYGVHMYTPPQRVNIPMGAESCVCDLRLYRSAPRVNRRGAMYTPRCTPLTCTPLPPLDGGRQLTLCCTCAASAETCTSKLTVSGRACCTDCCHRHEEHR